MKIFIAFLLAASVHDGPTSAYPPAEVPGATNPAVTQATIGKTICTSGYTATIRPSASYTTKLKKQQIADWKLDVQPGDVEEDHFISLEIGGNPTDQKNLWPQPYAGKFGARLKDQVEDKLHRMVCASEDAMPLAVAQKCITSDWIRCGRQIGAIK